MTESKRSLEKKSEAMHLFLEEAAQLVHHAVVRASMGGRRAAILAAAIVAAVLGGTLVLVLVLLDGIFRNASHDGTANGSEEPVVGLVTGETARCTTGQSAHQSTLALLGFTGSLLIMTIQGSVR